MFQIKKQSDTVVIVLHEIYGINQHIKDVCQSLSEHGLDIICPNFLEQEVPFKYDQEEMAYQSFINKIDMQATLKIVKNIADEVKGQYRIIFLLGFSIGATIAWLCSTEKHIDGIVGYYGSRIRKYPEVSPVCPSMLFFPERETSFNVDELIDILNKRDNVKIHKMNGLHGFSDPYSQKYNKESAQRAEGEMIRFLKKQV
ncbi:dienelactone hydrolase family protein [Cytobacillus gottheilii]|uniref:Dienelactone hydrolase family protein n=1 Tax=Cytobacillus gottheilii TaxID=859144 RepID=A0ABX8FEA8_9BACI|nr:dienelactone hydrolase family protein [Cytobacillus gottheilii]QVY62344.1 dienelactone hydrolase family protein [Cytobacillus gottheilii]